MEAIDEAVIEGGGSAAAADPCSAVNSRPIVLLVRSSAAELDMPPEQWVMIMDEVEKRK